MKADVVVFERVVEGDLAFLRERVRLWRDQHELVAAIGPLRELRAECEALRVAHADVSRPFMPRPSPVLMNALVDAWKMRPAPPVARSVVLASRM